MVLKTKNMVKVTLWLFALMLCLPLIAHAADPLSITPTILPDGLVGVPYSQTLKATGGSAPHTRIMFSGDIPDGLAVDQDNSVDGDIAGTPTKGGTYTFEASTTDSSNPTQSVNQTYTLKIADELPVTGVNLFVLNFVMTGFFSGLVLGVVVLRKKPY